MRNVIYQQNYILSAALNQTILDAIGRKNTKIMTSDLQKSSQTEDTNIRPKSITSKEFIQESQWKHHQDLTIDKKKDSVVIKAKSGAKIERKYLAYVSIPIPKNSEFKVVVRFSKNNLNGFPFGLLPEPSLRFIEKNKFVNKDVSMLLPFLYDGNDTLLMIGKHSKEHCKIDKYYECELRLSVNAHNDLRIFNEEKSVNLVNKRPVDGDTKYFLFFEINDKHTKFKISKSK